MARTFNSVAFLGISLLVGVAGSKSHAGRPSAQPGFQDTTPRVKPERGNAPLFQAVNDSFDLRAASIQTLGFVEPSESNLTTAIVVDGNTWTLELQKHSVRSPDFQAWVQDASGRLTRVEPPAARTYVGTVLELPGSEVRASFNNSQIEAVVFTSEGTFGVQPLAGGAVAAQGGEHAVFRNSDWINRRGYSCATDAVQHVFDGSAELETDGSNIASIAYKVAQIALDADFEFFQLNSSNVNSTIQDMENVINALEAIYESQLNITYEVSSVVVRTSDVDPYSSTSPSGLLGELVAHWNAAPQSAVQRDVLHLFTGKNLDGSVIGIAYMGAVCNQGWAYGLSQSRFTGSMPSRVALTAHELGHNWSAPHCNGCTACADCCQIMCSGLGGCTGILTSFGCQEVSQIAAFRDTRGCLGTAPSDECTTNADCDDASACTTDTCTLGSCMHGNAPNGTPCTDDGNVCTTNTCNNGVCQSVNNTNTCNDGNACTTGDRCANGVCGGAALNCDDGQVCTTDSCSAGVCQHSFNTNSCNDGNPCTTSDRCASGVCAGTAMVCDDNNPCTNDACSASVCQHTHNTSACDDGNACTANDRCNGGVCAGTAVTCNDNNPCTTDSCNGGVCQYANNMNACNDGNACTANDRCSTGACVGVGMSCNDSNPCTNDSCNGGLCQYANNTNACNDGNACTINDRCSGGVCGGTTLACNDGNPCTTDTCNAGTCQFVNHTNACSDGNACTANDRCTAGLCLGTPVTCDDGKACTDDSCHAATGCVFTNDNSNACSDGNACTSSDRCSAGACVGTPVPCDDGDPCTTDLCTAGVCSHVDNGICPDCNLDGVCNGNEEPCTCPEDCGTSELTCDDGADDDCDGLTDCLDLDCTGDPNCDCGRRYQRCKQHSDCCSGTCNTRFGLCR
jgi:hypothetical protein